MSNSQWKVEARQIFEQLLARTQITARNIARGVPGEELPDPKDLMKPAWQGMCTRYKIRSVGWTNISVSRFLGEFFAGLLLWVVGITRENKELWIEQPVRRMAKSRLGKLCGSRLNNLCKVCSEYGPRAWRGVCSVAIWCWSRVCGLAKTCWKCITCR